MNNLCFENKFLERFNKISLSNCLISDEEAKIQIKGLIQSLKSKGIKHIDMLDIVSNLSLPLNQIDRVMSYLEIENLVKSDE